MLLALVVLEATAAIPQPCGTPARLSITVATPLDIVTPPTTDLVDQESHGVIENVAYSDRFALKWGPDFTLDDTKIDRILGDFALARETQVADWEMNDPTGYGGTYFNVYIGDTGGAVPSVLGNAGYYTLDGAGYPMIVLSKDMVDDVAYFKSVVAHEFFHAVQHSHEAYFYEDTGLWYWETTASWAQGLTVPESNAFYGFLPWYALKPQSGLYHHSLDEYGGMPPDLHQYGAFIFPWYISEELHVPEAVLASWRVGTVSDDPMRVLESILSEDVVAEAMALAHEIAKNSPLAVQGTKRVMNFCADHPTADGLAYVAAWNAAFMQSTDLAEALAAFMQKREPDF